MQLEFMFTLNFSPPFLVVMSITPFAALEPYNADALAPFKTSIFSMSSGLISAAPFP